MAVAMQQKSARIVAGAAALVGWAGLTLQLGLLIDSLGPTLGLWRFVGFFTILTNLGAAVVASAIAVGANHGVGGQRARLAAATAIIMVGIVYSFALRGLWNPVGPQKGADVALHDATPLLWLLLWFVGQRRTLEWREIGWAVIWPALYAVYALVRGAIDGWYAYWFLDPADQSSGGFMASIAVLLFGFALVAAVLVALNRRLTRRPGVIHQASARSRVDEAGLESFPASDPPSWTLGEDGDRT